MNPWIIVAIVVGSVLLAILLVTTLFGIAGYFISLRRGNVLGRNINRVYMREMAKYGCDYAWWENQSPDKLFVQNDGLKLVAYLLKPSKPSKKIAILAHGYFQNHKDMQAYAKIFLDKGFNVLTPDARAHGESSGKTVGLGWLDRTDYLKWIHMMVELFGLDCEIVLFGLSMGAATVCMVSGEELPTNVKCVISDSAFDNTYPFFSYLLRRYFFAVPIFVLPVASKFLKWLGGFNIKEASTLTQVSKTKLPIFFIHGEKDRFVPTYMASNLYHTHHPEGREIYLVEKARHTLAYAANPAEYAKKVLTFVEIYVKG